MSWWEITATIVTPVLTIVAGMFAAKWSRAKNVIHEIDKALEDNTITVDEIKKIVDAAMGR